ncbi:uncharacterized protein LOC110918962 [Helianthus annuus]|uniref:uncharacterized protein LOC110918962 n=1 Tax=Helianthus annuus TaxID=4232 RepID=UPI000B90743E|nr:uncharacterized protein LOC110918962 [Helianthus annuus]
MKKMIAEALESNRREVVQQMKVMQDQIQELIISQNKRVEDEVNSGGSSGSKTGGSKDHSGWHPNDIKVDIPEYEGKLDPDEFVDWIQTVEWVFDYKQIDEDQKVKIVALKLRKYASTWWSNVCLKRERRGMEKIRSWSKMKEKMKQKFLPSHYIQTGLLQLQSLKQGSGTVEDYSREFEYSLMKCDIPKDDPQTLVRYLGGLEPRVANVVELQRYETLAEMTVLAHKIDSQQRAQGKQDSTRPTFKPNPNSKPNFTQKNPASFNPKTSSSSSPVQNSENSKAPRRCFRCQGLGHIASECTNKRIITLADFELAKGYEFSSKNPPESVEETDPTDEVVGPDEGKCLVLRRYAGSGRGSATRSDISHQVYHRSTSMYCDNRWG